MSKLVDELRTASDEREEFIAKYGESAIDWESRLRLLARNGQRKDRIKINPALVDKFKIWTKDNDITITSEVPDVCIGGSFEDGFYSYEVVELSVEW